MPALVSGTPPPAAGPAVSVVIPHLQGEELLAKCLDSLRGQTWRDVEFVLVDNGSTDGSLAMARARFPEVRVVEMGRNAGFAAACNRGAAATTGEFVWFLNDDAWAEPGCLDELLRAAREHPEAGSFAPKMLRAAEPGVIDNLGIGFSVFGAGYQVGAGEADGPAHAEPRQVFGASGGAAFYRRSVLDRTGGFDEGLVTNNEDTDLAFRAQMAGFPCRFVPAAVVHHMGAATGGARSPETVYRAQRNMELVFWQNMPAGLLALCLLPHLAYAVGWLAYWSLHGRGAAALRGKLDALGSWREIARLRRERMRLQQVGAAHLLSLFTWHLGGTRPAARAATLAGGR